MIEVKGVCFAYPTGVEALKEVSLEIRDGDFVAIMGSNGAGKTTLVKHFNGLLKPASGEVFVGGVNTRSVSTASLAREVGFVFQNPDHQLFCETVEEEVAYALKNFGFEEGIVKSRVTWALNLLGLTQYRQTSPFMLSGGERKRLALASVLAWDPQVVVLDEPTIGQDYEQKEKLRQFIVQLNAQGKTVVVVTHDVEFVADCGPRIVLMAEGKIVADGDAKEILTNKELTFKASIVPPQMTQIFVGLADFGLPMDVINVHEARRILLGFLKEEEKP
ncbi:MAG: energy-coupling factor ABC transporter ATP-binding protein [Candidatus Bathyarchaeota archaeon]|nr:energy-coupling factor ABC transporter ATP-binding protein [Candidatus Bathyarchaeota archaeon]